jgi:hypothetical protein
VLRGISRLPFAHCNICRVHSRVACAKELAQRCCDASHRPACTCLDRRLSPNVAFYERSAGSFGHHIYHGFPLSEPRSCLEGGSRFLKLRERCFLDRHCSSYSRVGCSSSVRFFDDAPKLIENASQCSGRVQVMLQEIVPTLV